jgi:hypothetical protein
VGMGGGKKGGGSLASKDTRLHTLRVQTSAYGQVIPILFGTQRIAGKMIAYEDFKATPVPSSGSKKAGGGGKKGGGTTQYTYSATPLVALCRGSAVGIKGLRSVYDTRGQLAVFQSSSVVSVPAGGGVVTIVPPGSGVFQADLGAAYTAAYSVVTNDYGAGGAGLLTGNQQVPLTPGGAGVGQYTVNPATGDYTFGASPTGGAINVEITYVYSVPNSQGDGSPPTTLNLSLFLGTYAQTAWSYMASAHAARALAYRGLAYLGVGPNVELGPSGALPNFNWEIMGLLLFGAGSSDAEPSAVSQHLLTDPYNGIGFATQFIDAISLANWRAYCVANGLFMSPFLDTQTEVAKVIQDLCDLTNTAPVWSEGLLKFKPYGDVTVVGNGVVYVPNTTPIYDLTDKDFLRDSSAQPVQVERTTIELAKNSFKIQFNNRAKKYNSDSAEVYDLLHQRTYGKQPASPVNAPYVTLASVAKKIGNFKLRRELNIRAKYKFKLGWKYGLLEPMDMVTLLDPAILPQAGTPGEPVRITRISEDNKGRLSFEAEEFPWGTATATQYPHEDGSGFSFDGMAEPGDVNAPTVFEMNDTLTQLYGVGGYCLGIGISGVNMAVWGGCYVWISRNGVDWTQLVKPQFGATKMGVLTANLPSVADPDTTSTLSVDLTESASELAGFTAAACDAFDSLCYVENDSVNNVGEMLSYEDATLTAANKYDLHTRLRRGVYGTAVGAAVIGNKFMFLDSLLYALELDASWIGQTVHLKFTSFNTSHMMIQALANVTEYTFAFKGLFKNYLNIVDNDATVDYVGLNASNVNTTPYTHATVRVYGKSSGTPTPGHSVTMRRSDGTSFAVTVPDFTGKALSTTYYALYNPHTGLVYLVTTSAAYRQGLTFGHVGLGWTTTPVAAGTGGGSFGGGGGGFGGGGNGVSDL